jgi:hypothetical protein
MPGDTRVFCSIVSRSYVPSALALAQSFRDAGNTEEFHILIMDSEICGLPGEREGVHFLGLDELLPAPPKAMRYYFDAFEFCCALKPFLVAHLIGTSGAQKVVYLDADVFVTGKFDRIWSELGSSALMMVPHQLSPPGLDLGYVKEVDVADFGFLNGGFSAWCAGPAADKILSWMMSRFPIYGFCDRERGMFCDQKLLPLLLAYFPDDLVVSRDPGLNVGYWNAHERRVTKSGGSLFVEDVPLVFFHASGFRVEKPKLPCAYLSAKDNAALLLMAPWLESVTQDYARVLVQNGGADARGPYGFDVFDGVVLNRELRQLLYRDQKFNRLDPVFFKIVIKANLRRFKRAVSRAGLKR